MIRNSLQNMDNWEQIAVIEKKACYSYRNLAQKAAAVQKQLPQKENVAIYLPNSADYIAALYGVFMSDNTAFPISTQLTVHEILPLLKQADVNTVITSREYSAVFKGSSLRMIYAAEVKVLENALLPETVSVNSDETMVLLSTSGTAGKSKIVRLSEKNVTASTLAYLDKMDFEKKRGEDIRFILGTPFSSAYGLLIMTASIIKSASIVVMDEIFTLDTLFQTAARHKATHFEGGVSAGLLMEQAAGRPIPYDISSLRYFGLAGSKLPASTLKKLSKAYPQAEFWPGYGMTEAGPLIAKPYKKVNANKPDSVGTAIDCVTIKIYSKGELTDKPYTKGEVAVKGPNVMEGYYKNEAATQRVLKDGYLYTGDIGYLDEEGDIYICGRIKNVIIVRGFNVHAEEVEACISDSALVKDCHVYGAADPQGNEILCADIVPISEDIQAETIRAFCKEHLAGYKCPVRINKVSSIKKTVTGKTERSAGG